MRSYCALNVGRVADPGSQSQGPTAPEDPGLNGSKVPSAAGGGGNLCHIRRLALVMG